MVVLYKLTDENNCTWKKGVEHAANEEHAYTSPLLAALLNPIHAGFENPSLWEVEGNIKKVDYGLKVRCTRLRTIREIPLPEITIKQHVRFAVLCAMKVCKRSRFLDWADKWLKNEDVSIASAHAANADVISTARAAADAAYTVTYSVHTITYVAAAYASAAHATNAAAHAANANAISITHTAYSAHTAVATNAAAYAAANAAIAATIENIDFDIQELAEQAVSNDS